MRHLYFICTIAFICLGVKVKAQIVGEPSTTTWEIAATFPYYNGVRMVRIQTLKITNYDPLFPPVATAIPPPSVPESPVQYLFVDSTGIIVKAFNSGIKDKKFTIDSMTPGSFESHKSLFTHYNGPGGYPDRYRFNGYYKVYDTTRTAFTSFTTPIYDRTTAAHAYKGLIDTLGNLILPFDYQEILPLGDSLLVQQNDKWGILDKQGNTALPIEYDIMGNNRVALTLGKGGKVYKMLVYEGRKLVDINAYDKIIDDLDMLQPLRFVRFMKDKKIGFIDSAFQEFIPPIYDLAESPNRSYPRLGRVVKNNKWGYLDTDGKLAIPCIYEHAEPFNSDSTALVRYQNKWMCINYKGEQVLSCELKPNWIRKGHNIVRGKDDYGSLNYYGLVDRATNEVILPLIYREIVHRTDNIYRLLRLGEYVTIDISNGKTLPNYDKISHYADFGLYIVEKDKKYGVMNERYEEIIPCEYQTLLLIDGEHFMFSKGWNYGLIDTTNRIVIPAEYERLDRLAKNDTIIVKKNGLEGMLDIHGKVIIPFKYEKLFGAFHNNLLCFKKEDKYGFVNTEGLVTIPAIYDQLQPFMQEITAVRKGDKWGFIDRIGKKVTAFEYESVNQAWVKDKYMIVKKNGKYGIINTSGVEVYECLYEKIKYDEAVGFTLETNEYPYHIRFNGE